MASPRFQHRETQQEFDSDLRYRPRQLKERLSPNGLPKSPRPIHNLLSPTSTIGDGLSPMSQQFEQNSPTTPSAFDSQPPQPARSRQPQRPDPFSYVLPPLDHNASSQSYPKDNKDRPALVRFGRKLVNACFGPPRRRQSFEVERIEAVHWSELV